MSFSLSEDEEEYETSVSSVYVIRSYPSKQRQLLRVKGEIGKGSQGKILSGTVFSASILNFSKSVAVKVFENPKSIRENIEEEIDMLKRFQDHDNVVKYFGDVFPKRVLIGFIMEKLLFSLNHLIKNYSNLLYTPFTYNEPNSGVQLVQTMSINSLLLYVFVPILKALAHINSKNVLFRDIKPDNIMVGLDENQKPIIKLVDFGCAIDEENVTRYVYQGTLNFKPPECYKQLKKYTKESESFCLGMNICYLFDQLFPFKPRFHIIYETYGLYEILEDRLEDYYKNGTKETFFLDRLKCTPEDIQKKLKKAEENKQTQDSQRKSKKSRKKSKRKRKGTKVLSSNFVEEDKSRSQETEIYQRFIDSFIHLDPEKRITIEDILEEDWIKTAWIDNQVAKQGTEFCLMETITLDIIQKFKNLNKAVPVLKLKQSLLAQKPSKDQLTKINANFLYEFDSQHPLYENMV